MAEAPGKIRAWLMASRPKTLGAAFAPVLVGTAVAAGDGRAHAGAALAALAGALLIQIGTNLANDYSDFVRGADDGPRLGPARATQSGWVTPRAMLRATALVYLLAAGAGLYLVARGGWPILLIGAFGILFGILYTAGPFPLGYRGIAEPFVLAFFGPVATGGTYYVQACAWSAPAIVAGLGPGLLSIALLTVNNLRDIETDRRVGKRTLAARFGPRFARALYLSCIAGAAIAPLLAAAPTGAHRGVALTLLILPAAIPAARVALTPDAGARLNRVLASTGRLLLLHSALFTVGWLL